MEEMKRRDMPGQWPQMSNLGLGQLKI